MNTFFYLAEKDGRAIAFIWAGHDRKEGSGFDGEIYAMYVLPAHQRRGIGKALTAAAARRLQAMGLRSLRLWVLESNPSRLFYERLGGRPLGEKTMEMHGTDLVQVSYGWDDLSVLTQLDQDLDSIALPPAA